MRLVAGKKLVAVMSLFHSMLKLKPDAEFQPMSMVPLEEGRRLLKVMGIFTNLPLPVTMAEPDHCESLT
jgi:hypothetical protein